MLPDLLTNQLNLIICGTAAGNKSAQLKQYYAQPSNKFWRTLHQIGLTPRILTPADYKKLLHYNIGLTDLVKNKSGLDNDLEKEDFGNKDLLAKIKHYQPKYLCFNGKRAAKEFLQKKKLNFGLQTQQIGNTKIFIAPSTSSAANRWWDEKVWVELAQLCTLALNPKNKHTNTGNQLESKTLYEQQKNIRSNPNYFLAPAIIAENLQTPENLGSILRLADAAGSKEVCFLTENKIHKSSKFKKTARNCESLVYWHTTTTTNFLNNSIAGYPNLIAIELTTKSKNLFQVSLPRNCTFIVGNERFGISSDLLKKCHTAIHVPMYGVNGSMNVTHALAIVLFEWRRQHA